MTGLFLGIAAICLLVAYAASSGLNDMSLAPCVITILIEILSLPLAIAAGTGVLFSLLAGGKEEEK